MLYTHSGNAQNPGKVTFHQFPSKHFFYLILSFLGFPLHNDLCIWEWLLSMFCDAPDRIPMHEYGALANDPAQLTRKTETTTHRYTLIYNLYIRVLYFCAQLKGRKFGCSIRFHLEITNIQLVLLLSGVTLWAAPSTHSARGDFMNKWLRSRPWSKAVCVITKGRICFQKNSVQWIPGFGFCC